MGSLLVFRNDSTQPFYINGERYTTGSPTVMSTELGPRRREAKSLVIEGDRPGFDVLFKIPHACIFLLSTESLPKELLIGHLPESHANLPYVFGDQTMQGIVVWANPDGKRITVFDRDAVHNLTDPKHNYSQGNVSVMLR